MGQLRLYFNNGKTPVLIMPDTPEYLKWHTPARGEHPWRIVNDRGGLVSSYSPAPIHRVKR